MHGSAKTKLMTRERRRHVGALVLALCVVGASGALLMTSSSGAGTGGAETLKAPRRWAPSGIDPQIADRNGVVRARIVLAHDQLTHEALEPGRRGKLSGRLRASELALLTSRAPQRGRSLARHQQAQRAATLERLGEAANDNARNQPGVLAAIQRAGGEVLDVDLIGNAIVAQIPAEAAGELEARADIAAIELDSPKRKLGLAAETAIVGAPSFWAAGFRGGNGSNDSSPTDLAIFNDKIQEDHPAFEGIAFVRPPDTGLETPCGGAFSLSCDHGTAVASAAISRGASGCGQCVPTDADQKGVAPGLDSVLDADYTGPGSFDELPWALGIPIHVGVYDQEGVADPAEVGSASHGSVAISDDGDNVRAVDNLVATFGLSSADASGNDGPGQSVNKPCIAYNTLCMGGFTRSGTDDPSDDAIPDFASRGPTPAGRKKPDLVAVATPSEYANRRWFVAGQGLWDSTLEGTSFASPQGAGALALLAGSGISDPAAQKAILINSARPGRATPGDAIGTQTGWQPDWGWGALDLDAALAERTNFQTGSVEGGGARLYKAMVGNAGERATLVWQRRATGCVGPGCIAGAFTLSDLDLHQLDPQSGSQHASSQSAIDNVEQVRAPAGAAGEDVIYKVTATSAVDGLAAEPFALASAQPLQALTSPEPAVEVALSAAAARQGEAVSVEARVENRSPELNAQDGEATLQPPSGVEFTPGSAPATQALGTLAPAGDPGDEQSVSWSVRGTGDGLHALTVAAQASRYGETFAGAGEAQLAVDSTPPFPTITAPSGAIAQTNLEVSWSATDTGVGVADYDAEVSIDGGPFSQWISASAQISASYPGAVGHSYRFRARARDGLGNQSSYAESGTVTVVQAGGSESPSSPPAQSRRRPGLRITRVERRRGRVLEVAGRVAEGVEGVISAAFSGRLRGRRVRVRGRGVIRRGRFVVRLRLTRRALRLRRASLRVSYPGNDVFVRQVVGKRYVRGRR